MSSFTLCSPLFPSQRYLSIPFLQNLSTYHIAFLAITNASISTMSPKIHLVRHAQGFHNLCNANTNIHDPLLTPKGLEQCAELQKDFPHHQGVDLIVSSPIRRTISTSLLSFGNTINTKGLTIIALPEVQETSALPCDTGSNPEVLATEFAGKPIDLSLIHPGWNVKTGKWAADQKAIAQRAQEAREWLFQRPENEVVVVTHGLFWSLGNAALIAAIVPICVLPLPPSLLLPQL